MQDDMMDDVALGINVSGLPLKQRQTWGKQGVFLVAYSEMGSIRKAAPAADVHRATVKDWRRRDILGFVQRFEDAEHSFRERLQDIAMQRIEKPEGNRGSDPLLSHMLNAHWPEKFKPELKREESNTRAILLALQQLASRDLKALPAKADVVEGGVRVVEDAEASRTE